VAWADQAPDGPAESAVHQRIMIALDDERRARLSQINILESDLAVLLAQTPYVLLLGIVGINVVSAAEFAGEMGPIRSYASSRSITRRAGLVPSRYQSDQVDRKNGPLIRCANRSLRQAVLTIADNLMTCNDHFRGLAEQWRKAGKDPRHSHVKIAARFCRIAFQMVAGGQVFQHPCCQRHDYILIKLMRFHCEHSTPLDQAQATLVSAVGQLPRDQHQAEAASLAGEWKTATEKRGRGPRLIGELLPAVLAKLGVNLVESNPSGEPNSR
jgi:transposase